MDGKTYTTSVPANLKSGQYLVRHEIIALHLADTKGGAEFYPSCTQVNVKGSGTGTPSASELVSFPGAYKDTDAGIFDKNVRPSLCSILEFMAHSILRSSILKPNTHSPAPPL